MTSRDNIKYDDIGDLGKKKYKSDKFKIPEITRFYSYSNSWSNTKPRTEKDPDLENEIEYISALVSDLSARRTQSSFVCEFNKWREIVREITELNKDLKRPIKAIRRRIYRFENTSNDVILEIETSLLRLLKYRNRNMESEFSIETYLTKTEK
jgi:hypothetical protein